MAKNEESEIDLTIGNKQLLSIVFILFVLFGVVFSMGYFVGRASSGGDPALAPRPGDTATQPARPDAVGPPARPQTAPPAPAETVPEQPLGPGEAQVAETAPTAQPPAAAAPAPLKPTPLKPVEPLKTASAPGPGRTFLQVAAKVKRDQAQMLADVLKDKGFRTLIVPMEDQQLYRTLVGPLEDASEVAKTKADLEALGFKTFLKKF
jgi:cell division septation protein DedD